MRALCGRKSGLAGGTWWVEADADLAGTGRHVSPPPQLVALSCSRRTWDGLDWVSPAPSAWPTRKSSARPAGRNTRPHAAEELPTSPVASVGGKMRFRGWHGQRGAPSCMGSAEMHPEITSYTAVELGRHPHCASVEIPMLARPSWSNTREARPPTSESTGTTGLLTTGAESTPK